MTDAQIAWNVVLAAGVLLAAGANWVKIFRREPPIEAEFVTKREFVEFRALVREEMRGLHTEIREDFRQLFEKIDEQTASLNASGERRLNAVYDRVNGIDLRVARIEARKQAGGENS